MLDVIRETLNPSRDRVPATTQAADADTIAHIVSSSRRRHALRYVDRHETGDLATVADYVTEAIHGPEYATDDRQNTYITLYQSHLKQLDRAGAIIYDNQMKRVARGPNLDAMLEAADYVESLAERGSR